MYFINFFLIFIILIFLIKYFIKKIKKYISILLTNGLDGVYYYFINKNISNKGIWNFIEMKKYKIGKKISKISNEKIIFGPYSGTKFLHLFGWSNIDFGSKYLGTYERQIQEKIISLQKKYKLKYFVDCGAAEGYHIVSLLKKKIFQSAIAFEIDKRSRNILAKNAIANKVKQKIKIYSEANFESIKQFLKKNYLKKTLFLLDIEGSEFDLFDRKFSEYFSQCYFIIEKHDFLIVDKKKIRNFYKNIKQFFKVSVINDIHKSPLDYDVLNEFSEDEKYLVMSEGRPKTMQWLLLVPK